MNTILRVLLLGASIYLFGLLGLVVFVIVWGVIGRGQRG